MTTRTSVGAALASLAGSLLVSVQMAAAQPQYDVLHAFQAVPGGSRAQLLDASDGTLYGVTTTGGRAGGGAIFALHRNAGGFAFEAVHDFEKDEGGGVVAALIEADGALYGTASARGAVGLGTIFKLTADQRLVVLHTFNGPDGAAPVAALVHARDGAFYGTTSEGGSGNVGTIFRMTADGSLTTLHSFDGSDGARPTTPLVEASDGNLYGTTTRSIFKMTLDGTFTTLRTFSVLDGSPAIGLVQGQDGDFYGALVTGIFVSGMSFFRITSAGEFTPLYTTTLSREGYSLVDNAPMVRGADGNFYGTLPLGGPYYSSGSNDGYGTAYRLTPSGQLTMLHSFTPGEGHCFSSLIQAQDGLFYGVTFDGGIGQHGLVFGMTGSGLLLHIRHFTSVDGDGPWSPPIRGADGALYGTTVRGGTFNRGTAYRISQDGAFQTLHSFNGLDGGYPFGGLLQATDGMLYGTTAGEGCHGRGTIFRMTLAGAVTVLHCFQPDEGAQAFASLIQARDGSFYGTTRIGGAYDQGTVFRMTPAGAFATILSLSLSIPADPGSVVGAAFPFGSLTEIADGEFIGTAANPPGSYRAGTVFATVQGSFQAIHRFTGTVNPTFPPSIDPGPGVFGGLTRADDGYLYGANEFGQLFRLRPVEADTVEIVGDLGGGASLPPVQSPDGNLYGTTATVNGSSGTGSIYRVSGGIITVLKTLNAEEGVFPFGVIAADNGWFYGNTYAGGRAGAGVIYRFRPQ